MSQNYRVALGAILTECNELGGMPIDLSWFERYELRRGDQVLELDHGVVGGMLDILHQHPVQVEPLLFASTCPGGALTAACYQTLKDELLQRLDTVLPVDGVLLPLHGAAAAVGVGDLEGDLIQAVRNRVGDTVPIIATLDLHAYITATMVQYADALLAWESYPHRDAFTTGQRGAQLLADTLAGRCRPTMAMAKVPVVTGAFLASTEDDSPFARMMLQTKALEERSAVLSTSLFLVHPYLDQPEMGSGGLVITDNDPELAIALSCELAQEYWQNRFALEPDMMTPEDAVIVGLQESGGPIVLLETADCCGGGAAGDSIASLAALLKHPTASAIVPVVDANAAATCHQSGTGTTVRLRLGHQHDPRWGNPLEVEGQVGHLSDGRFTYQGGIFDGVEGDMGPSAVLHIGSVQVLITTFATYDWADEQFRSMHITPGTVQFIVAKNPMNYRLAYGPIAQRIILLDTPGPTPATVKHVTFKKLKRPYFPLDADIPGLEPTILT